MYDNMAEMLLKDCDVNKGEFLSKLLTNLVYYYREYTKNPDSDYWGTKYRSYICILEDFLNITIFDFSVEDNQIKMRAFKPVEYNS